MNDQNRYAARRYAARRPLPGVLVLVVLVTVVIGGFVSVGMRLDGRDDKASAFSTAKPVSRAGLPNGRPGGATSGPVRCDPDGTLSCFPKASVGGLSSNLKAQGASCREGDEDVVCSKGGQVENLDVTLLPSINDPDELSTVSAMTFSRAAGRNARGRAIVIDDLLSALPGLLKALLVGETKTQREIMAWLPENLEDCPARPVRIGGYDVTCDRPTRYTVTDGGRSSVSSWSVGITVDSQTAFPR